MLYDDREEYVYYCRDCDVELDDGNSCRQACVELHCSTCCPHRELRAWGRSRPIRTARTLGGAL